MEKYTLTKTPKGKRFLYEVKDADGNVVSKRTSTRDYIACTANGEYYFGRIDLIGKGEHGRMLNEAHRILFNPREYYQNKMRQWPKTYRAELYEAWCEEAQKWARNRLPDLERIAYLK